MGRGIIVCSVVVMALFTSIAASKKCPRGTYLYTIVHTGEEYCIECRDDTFIPYENHLQTSCRPCEEIREPELEILISPCNKTHDAVIHCVEGFYRDKARNPRETGKCKKCRECKFPGQACSTYKDTVCCWAENYDVVSNHDGVPECRERPWFCRQGYYLEVRGVQFECLPCPENKFMPLDYHIQPECWKCREYEKYESYRPLHSEIIQPCNKTHAPVIRCEDGFFMKPNMGYRDDGLGCSPCTDCSTKTDAPFEGRKCDRMKDTVCCPHANMEVDDTPDGSVCTGVSASCNASYCLQYHTTKGFTTCVPCSSKTDVQERDSRPTHEDSEDLSGNNELRSLSLNQKEARSNEHITQCNCLGVAIGLFIAGMACGIVVLIVVVISCRKYLKRFLLDTVPAITKRYMDLDKDRDGAEEPLHREDGMANLQGGHEKRRRAISMTDHEELEQSFGNEIDLGTKKEACPRASEHDSWICVDDPNIDNLLQAFCDPSYLDYIKAVCDLTVRVRVYHVSVERPEGYPYYNRRGLHGSGLRRFGNGLVYRVSKRFDEHSDASCPCKDCQEFPKSAHDKWAEFLVVTSAQIVYDESECSQTSCKLWFNDDGDPLRIPSLKGWRVQKVDEEQDVCIMRCVSHDQKVTRKVEEKVKNFDALQALNQKAPEEKGNGKKQGVLILHPHGLSKRILQRARKDKFKIGNLITPFARALSGLLCVC